MKTIVLINNVSHQSGRESCYEYLMHIDSYGSIRLSPNVEKAQKFHSEDEARSLGLGSSYLMAECDGRNIKIIGYPI